MNDTDTSREALESVDTATLRQQVVDWSMSHEIGTADEAATGIQNTVLAVRPRVTELRKLGVLFDTGQRGVNISGRRAIIWGIN